MSTLLRIFTNYIQLITASISSNIKYPNIMTGFFGPAEKVGGSSDTFLSFDCFFSDTEILKIFDSTSIFKLFLTGVLPIILTIFAFATLMVIYLFNKRLFPSIKRNAIISFISILLLLHPKLASSSLSIFQCVQIDSRQERVRINTSIECYSGEHLKWCFLVGFPILAIWVTIIPLAGLFLLFRNIHKGEQNAVNQYFLILHQGLKKQRFYWEFVNSIRKVLILIIFALMITYPVFYRVLISTVILVVSIRLQVHLQPYRLEENNKIELLAISAGAITLMSGVVFDNQYEESTLQSLCLVVIIFINLWFILNWLYLLCKCMAEDYKFFKKITFLLALIVCIKEKPIIRETDNDSKKVTFNEAPQNKNANKKNANKKKAYRKEVNKNSKLAKEQVKKISPIIADKLENYRKELNLEEIQEIELEEVDESVKVLLKGQHINRNNEEEGITVFKVFEFDESNDLHEFRESSFRANAERSNVKLNTSNSSLFLNANN